MKKERCVFGCSQVCDYKQIMPKEDDKQLPYTVAYREGVGHHLVAVVDIPPNGLIMRECPVVVGPYTKTPRQCLQCFRKVDGCFTCSSCGFPMCGEACSKGSCHAIECNVFSKCGWSAKVDLIC